jgi:lysophospholipase L1-like esterase
MKNMNKEKNELIVVLGDSLACQRPWDNITFKDLYSFKLKSMLGESFQIQNYAKNFTNILSQHERLFFELITVADYYIVQIGIVDCAPRVFGLKTFYFLEKMKPVWLRKIITDFGNKHRPFLTKYFPKVYVKPAEFKHHYRRLVYHILNKTSTKKLFIINLSDTTDEHEKIYYNWRKNIIEYNNILENIAKDFSDKVKIIDYYSKTKDDKSLIMHDGHHMTHKAHDLVAKMLYDEINSSSS